MRSDKLIVSFKEATELVSEHTGTKHDAQSQSTSVPKFRSGFFLPPGRTSTYCTGSETRGSNTIISEMETPA